MEALGTPTQVLITFGTVPASPHTQCARPNNGAARSNCAHLSHLVQLLEQLKLADSPATTPRPTQRPTQHKFSFYTEPEKEQSSSLRCISVNSQDGRSVTAPNLFQISSKPKFLSKMFLLFYFSVSSLNLRSSRDSKLLTLTRRNKSRSKLKLYYCTWGVGILFSLREILRYLYYGRLIVTNGFLVIYFFFGRVSLIRVSPAL